MFSSCAQTDRTEGEIRWTGRAGEVQGCPTHVLAAVDELVYGHHAVFVLIHLLLRENTGRLWGDLWGLFRSVGGRWAHSPGKTLQRAGAESPLWGWGMCISPSCHRWPSLCPASPGENRGWNGVGVTTLAESKPVLFNHFGHSEKRLCQQLECFSASTWCHTCMSTWTYLAHCSWKAR